MAEPDMELKFVRLAQTRKAADLLRSQASKVKEYDFNLFAPLPCLWEKKSTRFTSKFPMTDWPDDPLANLPLGTLRILMSVPKESERCLLLEEISLPRRLKKG